MDNYAKNKLKQDIKKKITTTMIGALSSFENRMGRLWGFHKSEEEILTPQEEKFLNLWLEIREEILDRGNAQIGAACANLDSYDIEPVKYKYTFYNRRDNDTDPRN
jgi:hypothetical protein